MNRYLIIIEETATGFQPIRPISRAAWPRDARGHQWKPRCTRRLSSISKDCARKGFRFPSDRRLLSAWNWQQSVESEDLRGLETRRIAKGGLPSRFDAVAMDRLLLVASTLCFLLAVVRTVWLIRARNFRPGTSNFLAIVAGFVFQTAFLGVRGHAVGRCPLTNLFEVFIFMAWSVALIYMVIGSRVSAVAHGGFYCAARADYSGRRAPRADRSAACAEDGGESVAGIPCVDVDRGLWGVRARLHRGR